ncbi:MAG: GH3 auxin-responsive promoter family protein [Hyphomonadaceae bacterium]|nr:GH3 auxin-responsive promoter family protein [Hyphomonadaceae bacterium]
MIPQAAAGATLLLTRARHRAFLRALAAPEEAQARVKARIERALGACGYGRFGRRIEHLPVVRHEDLGPHIARMQAGERDVIWPGAVDHWMTTSGSSGAKKPIPITPGLKGVFASALAVWAHDVLAHFYRPTSGRLFMALAPPREHALTHEASFLGLLAPMARTFLVAPKALGSVRAPAAFRRALADALLTEKRLELISLWSPTYLLALMDLVGARDWTDVWPDLQFVSAWDCAAAAGPARELQRRLPHARFQGKGLIATEAPLTIPLASAPAPVPVLDQVYLEFRDDAGVLHPLADVRDGKTYSVVLSAPGGFLRYEIGDLVRVSGFAERTPCLTFIGRADAVCDLVGEKLGEPVAAKAIGDRPGLLLPVLSPPHYVLLTEDAGHGGAVEAELMRGHHYARARELGQLRELHVVVVAGLRAKLIAAAEAEGQSMDSIKDRALVHDLEKAQALLSRLSIAPPRPPP